VVAGPKILVVIHGEIVLERAIPGLVPPGALELHAEPRRASPSLPAFVLDVPMSGDHHVDAVDVRDLPHDRQTLMGGERPEVCLAEALHSKAFGQAVGA
jgi:hypothetical protein